MKKSDAQQREHLRSASLRMDSMLQSPEFADPADMTELLEEIGTTADAATKQSKGVAFRLGLGNKALRSLTKSFLEEYSSFEDDCEKHNQRLLSNKVPDVARLINPIEGRDLDGQQLESIAYDVRTRLVLAGAGTGKTTTVVGLVKYLLMSGKADPEDVLVLSFTNAAVDELSKRITNETGVRVSTTTFHRLGLRIIALSESKKPDISHTDLSKFVMEEIEKRMTDRRYMRAFNEYLAFSQSDRDESEFGDIDQYRRYLEENPLVTINGEKVKSFGEADIANYLALSGIPYVYEERYKTDTADQDHGQYHPDFHIAGTDVYIEYFGIDRSGRVAPFMVDKDPQASEAYLKAIEWKRDTHRKNGTRLVELFAYERSEGTLLEKLEKELDRANVRGEPPDPAELYSRTAGMNNKGLSATVSQFVTLILLVKGTGKGWEDAFPKGRSLSEKTSLRRTEKAVRPIYEAYEAHLKDEGTLDFEDMLNRAAEHIRRKDCTLGYRYVIVDEYQDLSASRYALLRSMRDSEDFRLFAVGDDWQSIYRFNGSNISYILDFEKYWGPSAICRIETTYRFSGELLDKSSAFICRGGRQLRKDLVGKGPECSVNWICGPDGPTVLGRIARVLDGLPVGASVLFLGRYSHDVCILEGGGFSWKPDISSRSDTVLYERRPDLRLRFMTIHGSKGLQSDYVISLNNRAGRHGFPSNRREPLAISLMLGDGENGQYDEERRLFYVAMTRARKALFLVSENGRQSEFYKELFGNGDGARRHMYCPMCGGIMVARKGKNGWFYGCSNFPRTGCKYTRPYSAEHGRRGTGPRPLR